MERSNKRVRYAYQTLTRLGRKYAPSVLDKAARVIQRSTRAWLRKRARTVPVGTIESAVNEMLKKKVTYGGNYVHRKRFRAAKPQSKKLSSVLRGGVQMRLDVAGEREEADICYIGHTTNAYSQILHVVHMALLKKLFQLFGTTINNVDDAIGGVGVFGVSMSKINDQVRSDVTASHTAVTTYWSLAQSFINIVANYVNGGAANFRLIKIWYQSYNAALTEPFSNYKELHLDNCYVEILTSSVLRLQNRTVASTATGNEDATNVENNPVRGRSYDINGNGTFLKWTDDDANTFSLLGSDVNGGLAASIVGTGLTTGLQAALKRPQPSSSFRYCYGNKKVLIDPGLIRPSYLSHRQKLSLDKYCDIFLPIYAGFGGYVPFGKSRVFALTKMIDSGVAEEPSVKIGYEILFRCSAVAVTRKPRSIVKIL